MTAKINTSMRLSDECLSNMDTLVKHYQPQYDSLGFTLRITKAQVVEILVSEKLREIKEEQANGYNKSNRKTNDRTEVHNILRG
ncbi:MAG TPA: hypothetical protein VNM69_00525 [Bacillus sp. (in: firmicutes)]|uniref:hypothetical protein n=1 Tax=Bacillus litorisediminis TaxID=2922713 RepID=UPI001FAFA003|nr:hypothetical protein [Bacillus litorisediminis]HWO74380.1 hypothetical protein [Bacillus sp. (in: firmicutes)]